MNKRINIPEYDVSEFNELLKSVIEDNFDYVRIRGEISELKNASSGHIYLTLKDSSTVLNATLWNQKKNYLKVYPELGMEVIVTGRISTYAKSISTYSINIDQIELAGEGALLKLIEDRKKKLKSQGIFDDKYKKKIPFLPDKIGIITSSTGSVVHDIINRVKERFPIDIDIWPVKVQGASAAKEIIEALVGFESQNYLFKPDVIILARGGGSTEDLMPFNDEKLAIKIFNFSIPIISAIGHETDTTIVDYVSDLRASTPTAAAEKAVPVLNDLKQLITRNDQRLKYSFNNYYKKINESLNNLSKFLKAPKFIIKVFKEKIEKISNDLTKELLEILKYKKSSLRNSIQLLRSPENRLSNSIKDLSNLFRNLDAIIISRLDYSKIELNKLERLIKSNSINMNLKKGFSIVHKSNKIITNSNLINNEDKISIQFYDKSVKIKIKKI